VVNYESEYFFVTQTSPVQAFRQPVNQSSAMFTCVITGWVLCFRKFSEQLVLPSGIKMCLPGHKGCVQYEFRCWHAHGAWSVRLAKLLGKKNFSSPNVKYHIKMFLAGSETWKCFSSRWANEVDLLRSLLTVRINKIHYLWPFYTSLATNNNSLSLGVRRNFCRGDNVNILLNFIRLMTMQCRCTFTKHFFTTRLHR